MKCDMCYDRTSSGLRPMCATVCPSQALMFGPRDVVLAQRSRSAVRDFQFGHEHVSTQVFMMAPSGADALTVDVEHYMGRPQDEREAWIAE